MELRSVEELMDLLHACRHQQALRTAALLRRSRPADKELQVAGLVRDIGQLLSPTDGSARAERAAAAVRPLLGRGSPQALKALGERRPPRPPPRPDLRRRPVAPA
jgi:hypothetical protein